MAKPIPLKEQQLPDNCFVFQHSTRDSVSAKAAEAVQGTTLNLPLYWINFIEQRPLSNWIAARYKITSQAPQLLLIQNGKVARTWNLAAVTRAVEEGETMI